MVTKVETHCLKEVTERASPLGEWEWEEWSYPVDLVGRAVYLSPKWAEHEVLATSSLALWWGSCFCPALLGPALPGPSLWEAWESCLFTPAHGKPLLPAAVLITFLCYLCPAFSSHSLVVFHSFSFISDPSLSGSENVMEKRIMLHLFSSLCKLVSNPLMLSSNQDRFFFMGTCS